MTRLIWGAWGSSWLIQVGGRQGQGMKTGAGNGGPNPGQWGTGGSRWQQLDRQGGGNGPNLGQQGSAGAGGMFTLMYTPPMLNAGVT